MFLALIFMLKVSPSWAAEIPWDKVALVEAPSHRCLRLEDDGHRLLCTSDSATREGFLTDIFELRFSNEGVEKRTLVKLKDTSEYCHGASQSVARFYGFESKDLNGDSRKDPLILIRAGNLKRKGLVDGVCGPNPIPTALYEVSFLNAPDGLLSFEPSYPVMQRLQKLEALSTR